MNNTNQRLFKRIEVSLLLAGLVIIALIVIFFVFFPWSRDSTVPTGSPGRTDGRIGTLEERFARIETTLAQMGEQTNRLEQHLDRFQRMEAALSLRLNRLSDDVARLKGKSPTAAASSATSLKSVGAAKKAAIRHHRVKRKETLYSISRQYGLTVGELRRLNHLAIKDVLHVGQRLKVSK